MPSSNLYLMIGVISLCGMLAFACGEAELGNSVIAQDSANLDSVANRTEAIQGTTTADSTFDLLQLEQLVLEAFSSSDFYHAGSNVNADNDERTGFNFCTFKVSSDLDGDVSFQVEQDSVGSVLSIRQFPVTEGFWECEFRSYKSKNTARATLYFVGGVNDAGNLEAQNACLIHDNLLNKTIYLCWSRPDAYYFKNIAAIMLLDCKTGDVQSFLRYVAGDVKYFATIGTDHDQVVKNCYVQKKRTPMLTWTLTELLQELEKAPDDVDKYLSVPISTYHGIEGYPMWYNNGSSLILGDVAHFPINHGR